jgi:hypothetical protein
MTTTPFNLHPPSSWTHADTMAWLNENPLPIDFHWTHRDAPDGPPQLVLPKYRVTSYGKWLRETPYFPGLFEDIHNLLFHAPVLPTTDDLVSQLHTIARARKAQSKFSF